MCVIEEYVPAQNPPYLGQDAFVVDQIDKKGVIRDEIGVKQRLARVLPLRQLGLVDALRQGDTMFHLLRRQGIPDIEHTSLVESPPFLLRQAVLERGGAQCRHRASPLYSFSNSPSKFSTNWL